MYTFCYKPGLQKMTTLKKTLLFVLLMLSAQVVSARMYQWVDPDTGTTQLSGKPPSWYRSEETGPRVVVHDNGRIIDDTGISLSVSENERLRQDALISVETDRQAALEKIQQARQQKATLEFQDQARQPLEVIPEPIEEQEIPAEGQAPVNTGPTAEELRALIDQYEQMKTQNARELVETAAPTQ
jgi:hypothetical protein